MANKVKKIAVLTSGGDAPGMNAAIRSVARTCAYHNLECVGVYQGYEGLINGDFIELDARSVRGIINKGGTFLRSARCERFRTKEGREMAYHQLMAIGADGLVVIGGDGSFTGALIFNEEYDFPVMGIPGTIDNDINGTDRTLGYDTALNTAVEAMDKIRDTAHSHDRLFFVEVMGRDVGHIALNSGVAAGAEEILIPEEDMGLERLLESLERSRESGKASSIVVVAEGDKIGKSVFQLKDHIDEHFKHYDTRVSVLGHMQRGGSPSAYDRVLASRMGVKAVESIMEGKSNFMVGTVHDMMQLCPLDQAIKGQTKINKELIRVSDIMTT